MGAANHIPVELVASPPCEAYRPRFHSAVATRNLPLGERARLVMGGQTGIASITALIFAAALVGFATNLSMHLLNLRMQATGVSSSGIGLSVAIQALGIIVAAPLTRHVIAHCGIRLTVLSGAVLSSSAFFAFLFITDIFAWNFMRFIFGIGLALLFTASESLIISRADGTNRGRIVGWYATALATGTTAGPLLVTMVGIHGSTPLLWGALLFWLPIAPIIACLKRGEELAPVVRSSTFTTLGFAPIAFVSAFVFGVADNGGMAMLSVYSVMSGYDYMNAATLAVFATVGAIVLQIPLGCACNKQDPRVILILCGVGSIYLLALLPDVMGIKPIAFGVAFGLGGLLEGLYTLGLLCIAKYYRGVGISTANGYFVSICGLGELAGPLATGTSMEHLGTQGFVLSPMAILALYIVSIAMMSTPTKARQ